MDTKTYENVLKFLSEKDEIETIIENDIKRVLTIMNSISADNWYIGKYSISYVSIVDYCLDDNDLTITLHEYCSGDDFEWVITFPVKFLNLDGHELETEINQLVKELDEKDKEEKKEKEKKRQLEKYNEYLELKKKTDLLWEQFKDFKPE